MSNFFAHFYLGTSNLILIPLFVYLVRKNTSQFIDKTGSTLITLGGLLAGFGIFIKAVTGIVYLESYYVSLFDLFMIMITTGFLLIGVGSYKHFTSYSKTYRGHSFLEKIVSVPYGTKRFITFILALLFMMLLVLTIITTQYIIYFVSFSIIFFLLVFNEWMIYRSIHQKRNPLLSSFNIKRFRKDVLILKIFVEFLNLYLTKITPVLGARLIKRTFKEVEEENPLLFGSHRFTKDNLISYESISRNTDRIIEVERPRIIAKGFSTLLDRLMEIHEMSTTPKTASEVLRSCYVQIRSQYGDINEFEYIIKGLPAGIADDDKMDFMGEKGLRVLVKRYTKDFLDSESKYRILFDNTKEGIMVLDTDLNILDINPKGEELLKKNHRSCVGKNVFHILDIPRVGKKKALEYLEELKAEKEYIEDIFRVFDHEGILKIMELRISAIKKNDQLIAMVLLFKDITEKVHLEERDILLYSLVRHDLKNKILVAQGYLDLLMESHSIDEEGSKFAEKAYNGINDGVKLLQKVKKIRDIDLAEEIVEEDIYHIINSSMDKYMDLAEEKGVVIDMGLKHISVKGGPLLEELFSNLIYNALVHSKCEKLKISVSEEEDHAVVTVEDDGKGVPDYIRDELFDIGVKGSGSHGSGLGLNIVKRIAERYGGSIDFDDLEDGGTKFVVRLRKAD